MFLIPGYAIVMKAVGLEVPEPQRLELVRYLSNLQREDGGWVSPRPALYHWTVASIK